MPHQLPAGPQGRIMKTKSLHLLLLLCAILPLLSYKSQPSEVKYYVTYGWENINYCDNKQLNTAWVYANVVKVNCDYVSGRGVFNQFSEHYASIYGRNRCRLLTGSYAVEFDTYDEAAAYRREKIAERQRTDKVAPILINNFSYYCK